LGLRRLSVSSPVAGFTLTDGVGEIDRAELAGEALPGLPQPVLVPSERLVVHLGPQHRLCRVPHGDQRFNDARMFLEQTLFLVALADGHHAACAPNDLVQDTVMQVVAAFLQIGS
jgi:hypothetical protein